MKRLFKRADEAVRKTRESARPTDSKTTNGPAFDAVAYAAALEILG